MRGAARFFHGGDFIAHASMFASEECAAIDDHVYFIRAEIHGHADIGELHAQWHRAARKCGGDCCDFYTAVADERARCTDEIWIHTDCGARWNAEARFGGLDGFAAEVGDFAGRVFSLERGEVHHRDDHFQAAEFRRVFDAAVGERGCAFLGHHLINGGHD